MIDNKYYGDGEEGKKRKLVVHVQKRIKEALAKVASITCVAE